MKSLTIATSLILSLLLSQVALADPITEVTVYETNNVITAVAHTDQIDFEDFSLNHAEQALGRAMNEMVNNILTTNDDQTIEELTVVAHHDSLDFEAFNLSHAEQALNEAMDEMVNSILTTQSITALVSINANTGS